MFKLIFSGNVTADFDNKVADLQSGAKVAHFDIANNKYIGNGKTEARYLRCSVFDNGSVQNGAKTFPKIERLKMLRKGTKLIIEASDIRSGHYTNKESVIVDTLEVTVDSWEFGSNKAETSTTPTASTPAASTAPATSEFADAGIDFADIADLDL